MERGMRLMLAVVLMAAAASPAVRPGFRLERTTDDAEVGLTLEQSLGRWPELHRRLWRADRAELAKFAAEAKSQRDELRREGMKPPQFSRELSWEVSATSPRLVSLAGTWYEYSGGAHPNHGYRMLLWSVAAKHELKRAALFKPPSKADAAIDRALCRGIAKARADKQVEVDADYLKIWPCPKFRTAKFALLPSRSAGGFGGFEFLFDPYEIGSYAEGEYEVVLPQAAMRPVLTQAWARDFAGEPKTPKPKD